MPTTQKWIPTIAGLAAAAMLTGGLIPASPVHAKQILQQQQQTPATPPQPTHTLPLGEDAASDPGREKLEAARMRAENDSRHKKMVDDAAKLLQLSTELKDAVDKSQKDELSVSVMKKAADVEKLAHDIRERMRQ